jgi:hypothetical protein
VAQVVVVNIISKRKPLYLNRQLISPNNQFSPHLKNQKFYVVNGTSRCFFYNKNENRLI